MSLHAKLFLAAAGVVALLATGALVLLHKPVDERWQACGLGDRGVNDLATQGGELLAAANVMGAGDVWVSTDHCESFEPWGLPEEVVWSVSYLQRAKAVCAGGRALFCQRDGEIRGPLYSKDIYWALETSAGVLAGGFPDIILGRPDASGFQGVLRPGYAAGGGAVIGSRVFVGSKTLLHSDDGGETFREGLLNRNSRVVAGRGERVYVGGGVFGGFLSRSDNLGEYFYDVTLPGSQPEALVLPTADPDVVLLGAHGDIRPGGLYLSTDGAGSWRNLGCPGGEIHGVAVDDKYVYCGARSLFGNAGLWRLPRALAGL